MEDHVGGDPTQQELQNIGRERPRDAKLRLEFAGPYVKEVQLDLDADGIPPADATFAFRIALRAENLALAEYCRVLRTFTKLVVDHIVPTCGYPTVYRR